MKKYLFILLIFIGVLIMLKPISVIIKDSIRNIVFRGNVVTGIVATDNGDGSYDVFISESDRAYPKIFTLSRNPNLAVGDKVRILYMNGCKELPIILPPTISIAHFFFTLDTESGIISKHSGINETILETFSAPDGWPTGLCCANGNLISCGEDDSLIYVHNGMTAEITESFSTPGVFPSGLAFDGTNLISCDWGKRKIYIHNGISSSILSSFNSPSTLPRGLLVVGGNLISCDGTSDKVYFHNGITASITSSFDCPDNPRSSYPTPAANGLTTNGVDLIMGDNGYYGIEDDVIFVFNRFTSEVKEVINAPAGYKRICGLVYF